LETLVQMEVQVWLETPDHLDLPDNKVHVDHRAVLDPWDHLAVRAQLVSRDNLAVSDCLDWSAPLDQMDSKVSM